MAGYSRLMEADEEGGIAHQMQYRKDLIDPTLSAAQGRIIKTTGDGMLVEFASASDAVRCALDLQTAIAERESASPEDRRIRYRIGINAGDTVVTDDDIFGDEVNVVARLEQMAEPGGAVRSER